MSVEQFLAIFAFLFVAVLFVMSRLLFKYFDGPIEARGKRFKSILASEVDFLGPIADNHKLCKICNSRIESTYAVCVACNFPGHEDCWSYIGRCGRYGCSSNKRYVRS